MTIEPIKQKLNIQDALYYEDLIYYLRKEGNLDYEPNPETEARIEARFEEKEEKVEIPGFNVAILDESIFFGDMCYYARTITLNPADVKYGFRAIRRYPEGLKQAIAELEEKVRSIKQQHSHKRVRRRGNKISTLTTGFRW